MGDVTVREENLGNVVFFDERGKLLLWIYRNSLRVRLSGENSRVFSILDIRNLCGGESDDPVVCVAAKVYVEVVEVSSCRTHYDGLFHSRNSLKMSTKYNTAPPIIQCFNGVKLCSMVSSFGNIDNLMLVRL